MAANIPDASSSGIDLDVLFRRYAGELQQHAFRRLKDREAAADVVQDSFVRFLLWRRGRSQVSFPYGSRSFLWKIVGNLTVDVIRRNRIIGSVGSLDDALEAIDPNPTPDRYLEAREQYGILKAALNELPPKTRQALLLNRDDGLSHAEVAAKLGVSSSMVTKYIMAGLAHCASRMRD